MGSLSTVLTIAQYLDPPTFSHEGILCYKTDMKIIVFIDMMLCLLFENNCKGMYT